MTSSCWGTLNAPKLKKRIFQNSSCNLAKKWRIINQMNSRIQFHYMFWYCIYWKMCLYFLENSRLSRSRPKNTFGKSFLTTTKLEHMIDSSLVGDVIKKWKSRQTGAKKSPYHKNVASCYAFCHRKKYHFDVLLNVNSLRSARWRRSEWSWERITVGQIWIWFPEHWLAMLYHWIMKTLREQCSLLKYFDFPLEKSYYDSGLQIPEQFLSNKPYYTLCFLLRQKNIIASFEICSIPDFKIFTLR